MTRAEISDKIRYNISETTGYELEEVREDSAIVDDLGVDDEQTFKEIIWEAEDKFGLEIENPAERIVSVGDLIDYVWYTM